MLLTLFVLSGCRYGQSLLLGVGGVILGVANKEREGKRFRERGRGDPKQASDSVSCCGWCVFHKLYYISVIELIALFLSLTHSVLIT